MQALADHVDNGGGDPLMSGSVRVIAVERDEQRLVPVERRLEDVGEIEERNVFVGCELTQARRIGAVRQGGDT